MNERVFSKDARDFLRLLAKHDVRYLRIDGVAVIYHGYARPSSRSSDVHPTGST